LAAMSMHEAAPSHCPQHLLAYAAMSRCTALLVLFVTACNSARSARIDGKAVALGASASVAGCPKCPVCAPEPDAGASVDPLPPLPPEPAAAGISWYVHTSADDGGPTPLRGIRPAGGEIPVNAAGWRCTQTALERDETDGWLTESVGLECKHGAARVRSKAECTMEMGSHDSARLVLGEDGQVEVTCAMRPSRLKY